MTKLLPPTFGPIANVFGDDTSEEKLSSGVSIGYPILRIKGKVWSISRGSGEPQILMRPNNDGPRNQVDVVILAASQYISKMWYESGYVEGSVAPPDCFSTNSIVPDASSSNKQCNTCAACPHNVWGSKITPAGKKAKACTDSKRLAVSPLGDIRNEAFGGAMLLRVPAASMVDMAEYGDGMAARGYKFYSVGTRIAFVAEEAFPKLTFEPIRPLNEEEGRAVLELRNAEVIKNILSEGTDFIQPPPAEALPPPAQQAKATNGASPVTKVTPKVTTPPPPPPANEKPKRQAAPAHKTPVPSAPSFSDGFGSVEPPPAPSPVRARRSQPAAPPPSPPDQPPEDEATADGDFEATLDAQLDALTSE